MEVEFQLTVEPDEGCAAQGPRALCSTAATVLVSKQDAEAPVLGQHLHSSHAAFRFARPAL